MNVKYFSVFDKKAISFGQVFPSHTLGTAERSFSESINSPDSPHGKYPSDFALYLIFELDDDTGIIVQTYEPPQLVSEALSLVS